MGRSSKKISSLSTFALVAVFPGQEISYGQYESIGGALTSFHVRRRSWKRNDSSLRYDGSKDGRKGDQKRFDKRS